MKPIQNIVQKNYWKVINMRFIESEKTRLLYQEVKPYLVYGINGVTYKEGTPEKIKEKHKLWSKLYDEERKGAEEFYE